MNTNKEIRRLVTFSCTAFNRTEVRPYFINDCCFGDDAAKWLLSELRRRNVRIDDEPGQEDFGWYLNFEIAGVGHCFVLGYRADDVSAGATWIGWLERDRGLIGSIFGRREHGIQAAAVEMLDGILRSSPLISDVRWHFQSDFDVGDETGAPLPLAT